MQEKYLIINAGSSSLKFSLYDMPAKVEIVNGSIEKIGEEGSLYFLKYNGKKVEIKEDIKNHQEAMGIIPRVLLENNFISSLEEIKGVGHRILHGGELYKESVLIDDSVIENIKSLIKLGPLHQPSQIKCVEIMQTMFPSVPNVAVFDTAFHQTMPKENYLYAVPYSWYLENGVRRYGFHGTSHKYITEEIQKRLNKNDVNIISCHIGSGASIACIKDGKSIDTTMGLTPLDGLIMGTRSGIIDPSIIEYICKERNLTVEEVTKILNKESGLIGLSGKNDYRDIEAMVNAGSEQAKLTINMLVNSIVKYIAQYYFMLDGKIDALVFTAGLGENAIPVRAAVVEKISKTLNVKLNVAANESIARFRSNTGGIISTDDSEFEILVIPTDEESMILKDTIEISKKVKEDTFTRSLKK